MPHLSGTADHQCAFAAAAAESGHLILLLGGQRNADEQAEDIGSHLLVQAHPGSGAARQLQHLLFAGVVARTPTCSRFDPPDIGDDLLSLRHDFQQLHVQLRELFSKSFEFLHISMLFQ